MLFLERIQLRREVFVLAFVFVNLLRRDGGCLGLGDSRLNHLIGIYGRRSLQFTKGSPPGSQIDFGFIELLFDLEHLFGVFLAIVQRSYPRVG